MVIFVLFSKNELLHHPDSSSVGYFYEVDLEYPSEIHDQQQDYPLAPEKTLVKDDWLSDYQIEVKLRYSLPENKVNKLLQTMFDKSKYVLHYKLLQLYVPLGLRIKKYTEFSNSHNQSGLNRKLP